MRSIIIIIITSAIFSESNFILSQSNSTWDLDSTKSYYSIAITPTWNKNNVSNRFGELDEIKGTITSGMRVDLAYLRFHKNLIYSFSIGHGLFNQGFYFNYETVSNSAFPYSSVQGYEKSRPMQYTTFKFVISNNFKQKRNNIRYYGGIDFRYNWGYDIFTTNDRKDVSYGSNQLIYQGSEFESETIMFQSNSFIQNVISFNPVIGLDYIFKLKNKTFLSVGAFFSIPLLPVIKSNVLFYPEFEDLNSSFNSSFKGGIAGVKISYSIPN